MKQNYKYDEYFNSKSSLIIILVIISSIILPAITSKTQYNFWSNLEYIFNNNITILLLNLAFMINIKNYLKNNYRYYILNRSLSYKSYVRSNLKDILVISIYVFISFIIIAVSGAILFSFGNFDLIHHDIYNVNYLLYIFIYIIKLFLSFLIINPIYYLIFEFNNKCYDILLFILVLLMSLFYLNLVIYPSFIIKIIFDLLELVIMFVIYKIVFGVICRKKRDIV